MPSLANLIVEKGIDNINVSMLDAASKKLVLVEAGKQFIRMGKIEEGAKAIALSGDCDKMIEAGLELISKKDLINACIALEQCRNNKILEELGKECLAQGLYDSALKAFKASGSEDMIKFIEMNLK